MGKVERTLKQDDRSYLSDKRMFYRTVIFRGRGELEQPGLLSL